MKNMKNLASYLLLVAILLASCESSMEEVSSDYDQPDMEAEAAADATLEEVNQMVEIGFEEAAGTTRSAQSSLGECVEVTRDDINKTVTIDFGEGCEARYGDFISGKIIVVYTDFLYVPGAMRTITFEDFYFNGISVQGIRTVTNTTTTEEIIEFTVTMEDGLLDFGDGVTVTREATW